MRKVSVDLIETVFKRVIDKLRFEVDGEVEVGIDLYFNIPTSNWESFDHTVYTESLFDDIDNLVLLAEDKSRPCMYVDFDRLAALLRAISEIKNPG